MGSLVGNLTKTGVQSPGGTKFYDNSADAGIAAAQATKAPETTYSVDGSIPQVGQDAVAPTISANSDGGVTPRMFTPTFRQASSDQNGDVGGSPLSPALKTKGKVLAGLLLAARGASDAIQGGALNARPGQSAFGTGFSAAAEAPRRRLLETMQDTRMQNEAAIQEQNLKNAPLLFNQKLRETEAGIKKDNALSSYYDAGSQRREQDQFKYVPGVGLVNVSTNQVTQKVDPKQLTPNSEAALRYAAAQGDEDAAAAVTTLDQSRKNLKATPSGGTGDKSALNSKAASTAAQFLQSHGGDVNAALADFNGQIAGKEIQHADLVVAAIKKGGGKGGSAKPKPIFKVTK